MTMALVLPAAAQGTAPAPRAAQPAQTNLGNLFSTDDYPADARRARAEGRVSFHLEISSRGRVSGCAITGSSGFPSLDVATCRILYGRARYRPARDSAGNPVPGTDNGWVYWRLPDEGMPGGR